MPAATISSFLSPSRSTSAGEAKKPSCELVGRVLGDGQGVAIELAPGSRRRRCRRLWKAQTLAVPGGDHDLGLAVAVDVADGRRWPPAGVLRAGSSGAGEGGRLARGCRALGSRSGSVSVLTGQPGSSLPSAGWRAPCRRCRRRRSRACRRRGGRRPWASLRPRCRGTAGSRRPDRDPCRSRRRGATRP